MRPIEPMRTFIENIANFVTWRYGQIRSGRSARVHRFTGRIQLRVNGVWTNAHPNWRGSFKPY